MKLAVDFILIIGILLNILALVGLLRMKQKKLPQAILIVFWFFILGVITFFYSSLHELNTLTNIAIYIEDGVRFFIPPLILLYLRSIFIKESNLVKKNLVHFIPFLVYITSYTVPNSLSTSFIYIEQVDRYVNWALVQDIYGIFYFILSLKVFYRFRRTMKQNYSDINNKDFLWLEKFIVCFLSVLVVDLALTVSEISFGYNVSWDGYITIFFIIGAMAYIGRYGLTQSTIFLPTFLVLGHLVKTDKDFAQKPYVDESRKNGLKKKFHNLMSDEKLYLSPDLNLRSLADRMEVSDRMLSAFFNEVLECSFYDAINAYRVEEALNKLKSNKIDNYTITGLGLLSGFSSKSSFYRVFKKSTGLTPSAFREKLLNESQNSR